MKGGIISRLKSSKSATAKYLQNRNVNPLYKDTHYNRKIQCHFDKHGMDILFKKGFYNSKFSLTSEYLGTNGAPVKKGLLYTGEWIYFQITSF